jgi:pyrroloquinoline quinone biosynthesis protein D
MTVAITLESRPRLPGYLRLQWEEVQQAWVLLYPEGMVKLNGSAGEIMRRLDGKKTVQDVVGELEHAFDAADLAGDVLDFLAIAQGRGWVQA